METNCMNCENNIEVGKYGGDWMCRLRLVEYDLFHNNITINCKGYKERRN